MDHDFEQDGDTRDSAQQEDAITNRWREPAMLTNARLVFACLLLIGGVVLCVWVVTATVNLMTSTTAPALVQHLVPSEPSDATLHLPDGPIVLPAKLFMIGGYLLTILALLIIVSIASLFVRSGVSLLQPDVRRAMRELVDRIKIRSLDS